MKRRILVLSSALVTMLAIGAGISEAASAHVKAVVCTATLTNHPENATPVWAYDTFTRTTVLHYAGNGMWRAHIEDAGRFTTVTGVPSDSGDLIQHKVTGAFTGSGDYLVKADAKPACTPTPERYFGPAGPMTGQWPVHYFGQATTEGITNWQWVYKTCREWMIETERGVSGHLAGLSTWRCKPHRHPVPTPSGTSTPTPTPTASSPTPSTSPPAPTPTETTTLTMPPGPGEAPPAQPVVSQPDFTG